MGRALTDPHGACGGRSKRDGSSGTFLILEI
jgi:hypothetical protein